MTIVQAPRSDTFVRCLKVLSKKELLKILAITLLQIFMSFLDLIGIIIIGVIAAVSVDGIRSGESNERINEVFELLNLPFQTFQQQAIILGIAAVIVLIGKSVLSIIFTRRIISFLSYRGALISAKLVSQLLSQSLLKVQARSVQDTLYSLTTGVQYIMMNVLAIAAVLAADLSLLFVMGITLMIVNFETAVATILLFAVIGIILYRIMHVKAAILGQKTSTLTILSAEKIVEVLSSYRETVVRNRRHYYSQEIGKTRVELSEAMAEISFMPFVSKYVVEMSIVLGAIIISAFQFGFHDITEAVSTLAIFLVAGSRIAPAFLRVQQSFVQIQGGLGAAGPTLDLIESLGKLTHTENEDSQLDLIHSGFHPEIDLEDVEFSYPGASERAISKVSLKIHAGSSVAIVGPSGAGKTTIIDVILGVLPPASGRVLISSLEPMAALSKWPGAVAYVPQDVVIAQGSIRQNVALGYPPEEATDERVLRALRMASLEDFSLNLPSGLDTSVGERGAKISGGQRQRLGIARALFTNPHLLILDEATSSLDGETEASVSDAIQNLEGFITVVLIAHRLSTVRNADMIVYMDKGRIVKTGSFQEVRDAITDFDRQARLMGL
jgi:ABC-type multidrug transport system fused ATPase/permease subunit